MTTEGTLSDLERLVRWVEGAKAAAPGGEAPICFDLVDSVHGSARSLYPAGWDAQRPIAHVRVAIVRDMSDARPEEYAVVTEADAERVCSFVIAHPDLYVGSADDALDYCELFSGLGL